MSQITRDVFLPSPHFLRVHSTSPAIFISSPHQVLLIQNPGSRILPIESFLGDGLAMSRRQLTPEV